MNGQQTDGLILLPTVRAAAGPIAAHGPKFFRFVLTGGFAALVNVASRYLLTPAIGFEASVLVAYLIGMVIAYILFRALIFGRSSRGVFSESYRFAVVNAVGLALVWLFSVGLARIVFHADDIAHLIGICVPAVTSYVGHARYTYK